MLYRSALILGTICALLSVIIGAFGAHTLKEILTPELQQTLETGVRYQFYHAVALLAVGVLHAHLPLKAVRVAGTLFGIGILLFSGSIYALVTLKTGGVGLGTVGILTPIGGLFLLAGWGALLTALLQIPKFR